MDITELQVVEKPYAKERRISEERACILAIYRRLM